MTGTPELEHDALERIERSVRPYTMVAPANLASTLRLVNRVIALDVPGELVECGVWKAGCSAAMLLAQREAFGRIVRPVWLLDSFEGLPPASEQKDGTLAIAYQRQEYGEYADNCAAGMDEARATMGAFGFEEGRDYHLVPGWFEQTAPALAGKFGDDSRGIALLRLDGDWYESTMQCLAALEPLVAPEGAVVLDDYYWWDGCARATHDYLSRHDLPYRIQSMPEYLGAYLFKRAARKADSVYVVDPYLVDPKGYFVAELTNQLRRQQAALDSQAAEIERLTRAWDEIHQWADHQQEVIAAQAAEIVRLNDWLGSETR